MNWAHRRYIFVEFHSNREYNDVDLNALSRAFYKTETDKFDFLVVFTNFATSTSNNAFHNGVKNEAQGNGVSIFDNNALTGSAGELESYIYMDNIQQFSDSKKQFSDTKLQKFIFGPQNDGKKSFVSDPRFVVATDEEGNPITYPDLFVTDVGNGAKNNIYHTYKLGLARTFGGTRETFGRGQIFRLDASGVGVVGHEIMHRWVSIREGIGGDDIDELIGRGGAHWIPYIDNRTAGGKFAGRAPGPLYSVQQGGVIQELGLNDNKVVELVRDENGTLVDDSIVIKDPDGVFRAMIQRCHSIDKSAFMTHRDQSADGSSALEQYLMGVRKADETPAFFWVDNVVSGTRSTWESHWTRQTVI